MDRESRERSVQGGHCPKEWVRPVRPHRGELLPQNVPTSMLAQDLQIWVPGLRTRQTLLPFPILHPSLRKKPGVPLTFIPATSMRVLTWNWAPTWMTLGIQ